MNVKKGIIAFSAFFIGVMQPAFSAPKSFEILAESSVNANGKLMTINTKMSVDDKKSRMENQIITTEKLPAGMDKSVLIMDNTKKIMYTLMPQQKMAMKLDMETMKKMQGASGGNTSSMNLSNDFMSNPDQLKEQIKKMGGKMVGAESILGYMCDIWAFQQDMPTDNKGGKEKANVKVWLSSKLSVPLKMEVLSQKKVNLMTMKVKSFKPDVKFAASMFEVPSDYKVTDMQKMMEQMKNTKSFK